jgi:hypothetical protein
MLPDLDALLAGYALYARQNGLVADRDESRLAQALDEAKALSDGKEDDEPAAVFFALARRPRPSGVPTGA